MQAWPLRDTRSHRPSIHPRSTIPIGRPVARTRAILPGRKARPRAASPAFLVGWMSQGGHTSRARRADRRVAWPTAICAVRLGPIDTRGARRGVRSAGPRSEQQHVYRYRVPWNGTSGDGNSHSCDGLGGAQEGARELPAGLRDGTTEGARSRAAEPPDVELGFVSRPGRIQLGLWLQSCDLARHRVSRERSNHGGSPACGRRMGLLSFRTGSDLCTARRNRCCCCSRT